jgi:ATP-dependent Clp protease adaptor protein ClpS
MSTENESTSGAGPAVKAAPRPRPTPQKLPAWNVILLNDDDHSYDYVIEMLGNIFNHSVETAFQMAKTVDSEERVIVFTTHKELAELKRDQIVGYGPDMRISRSKFGMNAVIEPTEG